MKLLLASKEKFLIKEGYSYLGISKENLRIGLINTAFTRSIDENFSLYIKEYKQDLEKEGIYFEEIDIHGKTENEIYDFFSDKNVIQVQGGNPLYLLKCARETSFDKILKDLLNKGLVYIGCSSGAHLMSPSVILGTFKKGRNHFGVTDFTAFGYVPYLVRPHYKDEMESEVREIMKTVDYKIRLITDDQAILIEDGKETFIGGPEIIL